VKYCFTNETNNFPKISGKIDFKIPENDNLCKKKKQTTLSGLKINILLSVVKAISLVQEACLNQL
jgi:hypothetical protein